MNENAPKPNLHEGNNKQEIISERVALAKELCEQKESFPFPGINEEAYQTMKNDEEDFPGFSTPIDEIIERCTREGIKVSVVFGANLESGNVFILPFGSDDIVNDSILPRHLKVDMTNDIKLKRLIEIDNISTRKD